MPVSSLARVLCRSERIHELLAQSAEQLAAANGALDQHAAVRELLHEASSALLAVNQALQIEIRDRTLIDYQLAAAMEQEEGARNLALRDHLTGLPNRALFKDRLEHGIDQAKRQRWILAVMFVDLDNFKSINDKYGHDAGDAVLQSVAARLADNARTEDTVSRYGGDEFLSLLAPLQEKKDVALIAAKILQAIRAPCAIHINGVPVSLLLEASIGISVFPHNGDTAEMLIRCADEAMYGAKKNKSGFAFAL